MNGSCRFIQTKRETWVDNVKVIACVLVVLGHFFQSMVQAELMPETELYHWFNTTIYYFHVPLFFLCSGYLFQKTARIVSLRAWGIHAWKKLIALGIPYVVFSSVTWLLKNAFAGEVNTQNEPFFRTLFLSPASPYWYLYALFFLFLIVPPFSGKRMALCGFCAALAMKLLAIFAVHTDIYAIETVLENAIWFVLGMCLHRFCGDRTAKKKAQTVCGAGLLAVFLLLSVFVSAHDIRLRFVPFLMGLLGCAAVIMTVWATEQGATLRWLSQYTMPIFLMHTIFAAGLRSVLLKCNITSFPVHMLSGLAISFFGPVIATTVLKKCRPLDAVLYPMNYIRLPKAE